MAEKEESVNMDSASSEEKPVETITETAKKKHDPRRRNVTIGVIVLVVVLAVFGLNAWHNTPGFCGTVCHSMSDHVDNFDNGPGIAKVHADANLSCLDCHEADPSVQLHEVQSQIAGDTDDLGLSDRYYVDNDKCLSCHGGSYEELAKKTADLGEYNPHANPHGEMNCNECHKGHSEQVNTCGQCHDNGGQTMADGSQGR